MSGAPALISASAGSFGVEQAQQVPLEPRPLDRGQSVVVRLYYVGSAAI